METPPKAFSVDLTELKLTKNMVLYGADDGKQTMVPPYFSQKVLMETFGRIPTSLRITVEATDA